MLPLGYRSSVPLALVTGASSGIGREFARVLAREGYDLVLVARSGGRLADLAEELKARYGVATKILPKDLADSSAPAGIVTKLEAGGLAVDVLVNNAGFASYGPFAESDLANELQMIQVNVAAMTSLTRLLLPGMVWRGQGRILNVASTAAFQPGPLMAVYYATKSYVLSFSEAIANELAGTGVTVTALCPGATSSGFQDRADMKDSKLVQNGLMSASDVAEAGYRALVAGKAVEIPGMRHKIFAQLPRFLPRSVTTKVVRRAQAPV
jgi:short-subunit dehydrogenase